ncbi:MAG: hypothetical protein ACKN9T_09760 [Candidatus Methylumidiphilus sp.]
MSGQLYRSITAVNQSAYSGTVWLFQTNKNNPGVVLAWLAQPIKAGGHAHLQWAATYNVFWAGQGALPTGTLVNAQQLLPCSASSSPQFALFQDGSSYTLMPEGDTDNPGISFVPAAGVPANAVSVGVAMDTAAIFAAPVQPGATLVFPTTQNTYWIAFSPTPIQPGTVIKPDAVSSAKVAFPPGLYSCQATYGANGAWALQYAAGSF